jgi:hypothetical protein
MLGKIAGLKIIIVRNKPRGVLKAYVEQEAADGAVRGSDLIRSKHIIHMNSAKHYIQWMLFPGVAIEWVVEEGEHQMEDNSERRNGGQDELL